MHMITYLNNGNASIISSPIQTNTNTFIMDIRQWPFLDDSRLKLKINLHENIKTTF